MEGKERWGKGNSQSCRLDSRYGRKEYEAEQSTCGGAKKYYPSYLHVEQSGAIKASYTVSCGGCICMQLTAGSSLNGKGLVGCCCRNGELGTTE